MCKDNYGHEHIMEKFGLDLYEERLKQEETLRRRISFITCDLMLDLGKNETQFLTNEG